MPTPKKGARLGGSAAHQKLILANLATSLFEHGRITTTEAKARVLRPHAEKLITKAKKGDLHNRRQVLATIKDKGVVHALFEEIAPRYAERPGGYTRITKIGPRKGDNAPMAVIELVTEAYTAPASGTGFSAAAPASVAAAPVEEVAVQEPAQETHVEDTAVEDTAVEVTAAEDTAAEDTTAEDASTEETPAESVPVVDTVAEPDESTGSTDSTKAAE